MAKRNTKKAAARMKGNPYAAQNPYRTQNPYQTQSSYQTQNPYRMKEAVLKGQQEGADQFSQESDGKVEEQAEDRK